MWAEAIGASNSRSAFRARGVCFPAAFLASSLILIGPAVMEPEAISALDNFGGLFGLPRKLGAAEKLKIALGLLCKGNNRSASTVETNQR